LASAKKRTTRSTLNVTLFQGDLTDSRVLDNYVKPQEAQVVSAMFAVHYAFGTDENARSFFESAYRALSPGGVLVGTRVNPIQLGKFMGDDGGTKGSNYVCSVECESPSPSSFTGAETTPCGGGRYFFTLEDSVNKCPEYVVGKETFCDKAKEVGFQDIEFTPFTEFAKKKALEFPEMYTTMIRDHRYCTRYGPPEMNCHQVFELYDVFFAYKHS
jgi:SAM-dependent methyltransferase